MRIFAILVLVLVAVSVSGCEDIEDAAVADGFGQGDDVPVEETGVDDGEDEVVSSNFNCDPSWGVIIDGFDSSMCFMKALPEDVMIFTMATGFCRNADLGGMEWDALSYDEAVEFVDYFSSRGVDSDINVYLAENYGFENADTALYWSGEFESAQNARSWVIDLRNADVYWMDMSRTHKVICVARSEDN